MNRGVIIHLDNDYENILNPCKNLFEQYGIELEYVTCKDVDEFRAKIEEHRTDIKALIFDLIGLEPSNDDIDQKSTEFLDSIRMSFNYFSIPIFIYSGYLQSLNQQFSDSGTVFKIDKELGIAVVFDKIKLFLNSGFINVFCPGGILEKELHKDLNLSFVKQFNDNSQIENIINDIITVAADGGVSRVEKVFKRIAVRSLLSGLLAPDVNAEGIVEQEFLHPCEHYLQRISPYEFWTGDIFKENNSNKHLLIITPRCNVASKKSEELLVCEIDVENFPTRKEKVSHALTDKPEISGYDRYLPPSASFIGGKVLLSKYSILKKDDLSSLFKRQITLSDELTNEILGKFGAYFFRSGITPYNFDETLEHISKGKDIAVVAK
ncbi:hypothetical protein [Pedobacter steynii]|uniref:Uncharacterized protein n=1 Tax=Pedobacter steynii TaxID=430522 RepID=A0A1D7QKI8_9SPHI|nr:hypothetical protein [Pedobacter steynii]AOM79191.1 hypothetical protein BFS30_19680 [Pedobacter steynii]